MTRGGEERGKRRASLCGGRRSKVDLWWLVKAGRIVSRCGGFTSGLAFSLPSFSLGIRPWKDPRPRHVINGMGPRKLVPLLAVAPIFMRSPREGGQKGSSPPPWPEGDPGSWNSSRFSETLGPLTANQPLSLRVLSLSLSSFVSFFFLFSSTLGKNSFVFTNVCWSLVSWTKMYLDLRSSR